MRHGGPIRSPSDETRDVSTTVNATLSSMVARIHAGVVSAHGGPDHLEYLEVEAPSPPPGWVRVRVLACALNMLDVFVRRGMPGVKVALPHVPGGDVVGVVDQLGDGVTAPAVGVLVLVDPRIGEGILGEHLPGGLAELVVVPASNAIELGGTAPADAPRYAALPIAYGTARRMLVHRAGLQGGETVVVLGAAGGVGVACTQLASALGARVIACSSSRAKLDRLAQLGARELVDTSEVDFSRRVWELTDRRGADIVIDYIGADTWPGSLRALRRGGRLVTCGASSGFLAQTDLRYVWTRELNLLGSDGWGHEDLLELVGQVRNRELEPEIYAVYPLSEVRRAVADIEERRAIGKVVVVPDACL
jgi:NADPH:quinone reductase-like Zn-dependent oxidoreductase